MTSKNQHSTLESNFETMPNLSTLNFLFAQGTLKRKKTTPNLHCRPTPLPVLPTLFHVFTLSSLSTQVIRPVPARFSRSHASTVQIAQCGVACSIPIVETSFHGLLSSSLLDYLGVVQVTTSKTLRNHRHNLLTSVRRYLCQSMVSCRYLDSQKTVRK